MMPTWSEAPPAQAAADRCVIRIVGGIWVAQEYVKLPSGALATYGRAFAATVVAADVADVALSGADLTLKSGLTVTTQPHAAQARWSIPLISFTGMNDDIGSTVAVELTCDINFTVINAFLGVGFAFPSGSYDNQNETGCFVGYGYGNTSHPSQQRAAGTGAWTTVNADVTNTMIRVQQTYCFGSVQATNRAFSIAPLLLSEGANGPPATPATHLFIVGFVKTAALLADAAIIAPVITIYYGR